MDSKKVCLKCGQEFMPLRSDAKFCSSTCKAKHWEQNKSKKETTSVADSLRGVIKENPQPARAIEINTPKEFLQAKAYWELKCKENEFQTSKKRLEEEIKRLKEQINSLEGYKGEWLWLSTNSKFGVYLNDSSLWDIGKDFLEKGSSPLLTKEQLFPSPFKNERKRVTKSEGLAAIRQKIAELDVSLTSINQHLTGVSFRIAGIELFLIKTNDINPLQRSFFSDASREKNKMDNSSNLPISIVAQKVVRKPPSLSEKIISSKDLQKIDYRALSLQGRWLDFFGYPSINFHCVIHGMSGEGKSTFTIQFANYLAENFGTVVYISGEEGFSKTFKDKFINNNAVSDALYVADLRSFDNIINEVGINAFNFIFIDSLDNMKIDASKMKELRERYKDSALITISQSTKEGKMRGSYEIVHDCDIAVYVQSGLAITTKNRFKEKEKQLRFF